MIRGRGSLTSHVALAALVLAVVAATLAGAAATGALPGTAGDAQPDAETVLERAGDRYANAETLVVEANVTVETPNRTESATVSVATARPDSARVVVTRDDVRYAAGTNGSIAWVQTPGGAVVALPVPDVNHSRLDAALEDLPSPERLANGTQPPLPANGSVPELPANWSGGDLPANWSDGDLPANRSLSDALANRSDIDRPATNGSLLASGNWSAFDWGNWSSAGGYNWSALTNGTAYDGPNVTVETTGTETVDGTETYVLELRSTVENASLPGNATLWVATEDYTVRRARATYDGYRVTVDVTTTQFNASIQESTFRPPDRTGLTVAPRATYDSFDAAQTNTSVTLTHLDGYDFANATVATQAGQTVAVQQYAGADGQRVALVATRGNLPFAPDEGESVTVAGANATVLDLGDRSAVVWEESGVTRAVVADLPQSTLVEVAATVRS